MKDRAAARRTRITVRKVRLGEEDDRLDREFWAQITPDERLLETWRLSLGRCRVPDHRPRRLDSQQTRPGSPPRDLADLELLGE